MNERQCLSEVHDSNDSMTSMILLLGDVYSIDDTYPDT